jgi:hypothetical protein
MVEKKKIKELFFKPTSYHAKNIPIINKNNTMILSTPLGYIEHKLLNQGNRIIPKNIEPKYKGRVENINIFLSKEQVNLLYFTPLSILKVKRLL